MRTERTSTRLVIAVSLSCLAASVSAQTVGTFRWQQQPYCNIVTVTITQVGAVYRLEGTDDQCGTPRSAATSGIAFLNPNGTVGMGLAVVTNDGGSGGTPLHIDATIALSDLSGTWRDSAGNTGAWVFTPATGVSGGPRPTPRLSFPGGVTMNGGPVTNIAAPTAPTDAANKNYVDAFAKNVRSFPVPLTAYSSATTGNSVVDSFGCVTFDAAGSFIRVDLPLPEGASLTGVRVKYRHAVGASASMAFIIRTVDFADGANISESFLPNILTSSPGANGNRVQTITASPVPIPVSATRAYYLSASAPVHAGLLAFCGATAFYTLP